MSSQKAQHAEDLNFRVLRLLQDNPEATQRELPHKVGVSHGKMNYCLNALIDKGLVKLVTFQNSQHKFKYVYLLTPVGIAEKVKLTGRFLQRKVAEYERLKAEIEGLRAEHVEHEQQVVGMVYCALHCKGGHLESLAVDPEYRGVGLSDHLVNTLVDDNPGVISLTTRIPAYFERVGFSPSHSLDDGSVYMTRVSTSGSNSRLASSR
jgi:EPS-associated MarR family transcriptional regulator